jgi:pimeloyl-ACP methyl ester carboxylesterase
MKNAVNRPPGVFRAMFGLLGMSSLGALALAGIVALRHMLNTPQALESQLPGEAHLYRWKDGHIFYKLLGAPGAPPLVLLHSPGLAASAYEMRGIMESLAKRFRVYAPDLPGFGLSDRPSLHYTADLYLQICREFLAKEVKQPALLVASGFSCNYAVVVAARSPELCSGLVLISPLALRGEQAQRFFPPALLEARPVKTLLYPLLVQVSHIVSRNPYYYATTHRFGAEHAAMALLAGRLVEDVSRDIEGVRQPALVIWGTDALGKLQRTRFTHDELLPAWGSKQAHVELLLDGGLSVHEEQPQRVAETVLQWSAQLVPATPAASRASISSNSGQASQRESPAPAQSGPPALDQAPTAQVEAYCMKCKVKRPIQGAREITMKNGRIAVHGDCAVCGTQLFRTGRLAPGYPHTPV